LRRSWPKFEIQELVSFDGPTQSQAEGLLDLRGALGALLGADDVGESEALAAFGGEVAVVAAVQVQGLNIEE
jgi:hypothetical protein